MKNQIITISREFGSGGRYIGSQVAECLNIPFYDKHIIEKTAEESGLSKEFIEKKGEYSPAKNIFAYAFVGRDTTGSSIDDYLYSVQRKIIIELAEKGPCVIVGRCADFILKDSFNCLNVFIYGNEKEKLERICRLYDKSESEAKRLLKDVDKKRSINYKYYTDRTWGNIKNYSLTMNSSELGYEACIKTITELVK